MKKKTVCVRYRKSEKVWDNTRLNHAFTANANNGSFDHIQVQPSNGFPLAFHQTADSQERSEQVIDICQLFISVRYEWNHNK